MENTRIQSLADTLKNTGLASSVADAMNMARNILGTEQKVSSGFERYVQSEPVGKPKTYKEEIDELIRKTSPEYKQYHVPIKGYVRENSPKIEVKKEEPKSYFFELEEVKTNQNVTIAQEIKPVYTDIKESDIVLHDLVTEDQGDVLSNSSNVTISPLVSEETEQASATQDEFIMPVEKEIKEVKEPDHVLSNTASEKPEQMFKEIKEDKAKPREIKNPIESVDLMAFFKSG